jgi:hypothetical protein
VDPSDYYRPPKADLGTGEASAAAAGAGKVYSTRQIMAATFLGTTMAGAILMAGNATAFGEGERRRSYLVWGGVATALLMVVALLLPDRFPSSILPLGYTLALHAVAGRLQGVSIQRQLAAGNVHHSNWRVFGIGIASMAAVLSVVFVVAVAHGLVFGFE